MPFWLVLGLFAALTAVVIARKLDLLGLWLGMTYMVGVLASMAGTPFWLGLERVFGSGFLGQKHPFWIYVVVHLSVALLILVGRAFSFWRLRWGTLVVMAVWANVVFGVSMVAAPRGRYLPPLPWLR